MATIARERLAGTSCAVSLSPLNTPRVAKTWPSAAWGRFDHQPSVGRDGGNAVDDVSHGNDDERSERRDHDMGPTQPKRARARRLQTASNFGWARRSVANGS